MVSLSPRRPVRRVVRIVCFSGLVDLEGFGSGDGNGGGNTGARDEEGDSAMSSFACAAPTTAFSDDVLVLREGRFRSFGRESSVYVAAGTVPPPIHPLSGSEESGVFTDLTDFSADEEESFCCDDSRRESRNASRRSMRSLHCSSSCRKLSTSAFSVSDRGVKLGWTLFA